jgi:hypothetical protein
VVLRGGSLSEGNIRIRKQFLRLDCDLSTKGDWEDADTTVAPKIYLAMLCIDQALFQCNYMEKDLTKK